MINIIKEEVKIGQVFNNPGGGTSEIVNITNTGIYYKRGKSTILIKYLDIENVFNEFEGKEVSTNELKKFNPKCFDSCGGGHSCNCTFLFTILKEYKLISGSIGGQGKVNNPFSVTLI